MLFDWIGASVPVDVESIDWSAVPIRSDLQPLHDRRGREVRADPRVLARREAGVSLPSVASGRRGSGVTGTCCSAGGVRPVRLFVHHLGFLGRGEVVDFAFGVLGQLLHVVLGLVALIFGEQFLLFARVGVFVGIASDVSDGDPGFFGEFFDAGDELSSSFGRECWDVESNESPIGVG